MLLIRDLAEPGGHGLKIDRGELDLFVAASCYFNECKRRLVCRGDGHDDNAVVGCVAVYCAGTEETESRCSRDQTDRGNVTHDKTPHKKSLINDAFGLPAQMPRVQYI